jgi:predicted NBD/HSP70 family sugar kinase
MPEASSKLPGIPTGGSAPRPGELRFATAVPPVVVPGASSARLVLVIEVDAEADFVLAMLTTNEIEMADDMDLVPPERQLGLPFPLSFETNLVGPLWISQLEPKIGTVEDETFQGILEFRQGSLVQELLPYQGLPLHDLDDPRWRFKVAELAAMQALSASCMTSLIGSEKPEGSVGPTTAMDEPGVGSMRPVSEEPSSAVALGTILSREPDFGPQSLREVAESTGLPQAMISRAVTLLVEHGFVIKDPEDPRSLRINESRPSAVGVSIRADELIGVVTNLRAADLVPVKRRPLPSTEVSVVVEAVKALVTDLLEGRPNRLESVMGLGVELSGHIDGRYGDVVYSPDLKSSGAYWTNIDLASRLHEATGLYTVVENDANAFALHEQWFGEGVEAENFAVVFVSSQGIGCGLVIDGALVHGSEGIAGEIGHLVVDPGGPRCRCGNEGCLEAIASPVGICDAIGEGSGLRPADLEEAARRMREGDPSAIAAFQRAGEVLGRGLSMVLNLVNPSLVILFGPAQLTNPESEGPPAALFKHALEQAVERCSFSFAAWRYKLITRAVDLELGPKGAASAVLNRMMVRPRSRLRGRDRS